MVATVLKHEWIRTRVPLAAQFGISTLVVALASALAAMKWPFVSGLGLPVGIAAICSLLVGVLVYLTVDFWRTGFGRLGYLTQALPVRSSTIVLSKLSYGVVAYLVTVIVAVGLSILLWAGFGGAGTGLTALWELCLHVMPSWAWVVFPLILLIVLMLYVTQAYCAASVGSEPRWRSMGAGGPIVVWLLFYLVSQAVTLVTMLTIPVAVGLGADGKLVVQGANVFALITQGENNEQVPVGFIVGMGILVIAFLWRTIVSWNRKITLS